MSNGLVSSLQPLSPALTSLLETRSHSVMCESFGQILYHLVSDLDHISTHHRCRFHGSRNWDCEHGRPSKL